MQDNALSRVAAQGRPRRLPSQRDNKATSKSILTQNPKQPTQAPKADITIMPADGLIALPATALASIFHHLDSVAGLRLAQTCRTCGTEFAHQRSDFTRKAWKELAPTITRDPAGPPELAHSYPYGTYGNPVSMHLKWEKNPGSALRRLYAISQQPDHVHLVNEMWRQAWPKTLWSDLLCDGMPEKWPVLVGKHDIWGQHPSLPCINIEIQVASDEQLQLRWNWLALLLLYAPAAGLTHLFYANAPQLREKIADPDTSDMQIHISLQRPAQGDQCQLIMHKTFWNTSSYGRDFWSGTENAYDTDDIDSWYGIEFPDTIQVTPYNMQQVAITGRWCQVLPDASWYLWGAHHGLNTHGMTEGDDIAVDLWDVYLAGGCDWCQCFEGGRKTYPAKMVEYCSDFSAFWYPPSDESTEFTPFTCEVVGQSDWKLKRQQAKQQAKVKKVKAKGRKRKAGKSRPAQASLTHQDVDWVIPCKHGVSEHLPLHAFREMQ